MKRQNLLRIAAAAVSLLLLAGCSDAASSAPESSSQLTVSDTIAAQSSEPISSEETSSETTSAETESELPQPEVPKKATVTLTAVGDNLIHRPIYQQANERAGGTGYDFAYAYRNVADKIASSDLAIYNQETIIAPDQEPSSYPRFNSPKELGDHMVNIGFDVASLANNHSYDMWESGLKSCLEYWSTKDILTTGAYIDENALEQVSMVEVQGIKFGFVAFTDPDNGLALPQDSKLTVLQQENFELIERKVRQADAECDVVIVLPHWGLEYTTKYTDTQKLIAQKLADCGADLIIGSHSHCIQPIEVITSADGREVPVCYSLGNFISGQTERLRTVGGLVDITLTYDFETQSFTFDDIDFEPVITHYVGGCKEICNYLYRDYSAELAANHGVVTVSEEGKRLSLEYIENLVTSTIDEQYLADGWKPNT